MYKNVLVAVDGSATGQRALSEALKFAQGADAQLRIVNVVDDVSLNRDTKIVDPDSGSLSAHESALDLLERAVATAREAGASAESKLLRIDRLGLQIADVIVAEAQAWEADLVVVGTHGRQGVRRLLLGSVAESVARIASTPVLLVRGE
jgi:nucleotide-binding universal stress UspA family protein